MKSFIYSAVIDILVAVIIATAKFMISFSLFIFGIEVLIGMFLFLSTFCFNEWKMKEVK